MVSSFPKDSRNRRDCPILFSLYSHRQRKQSKAPTIKTYHQIPVSSLYNHSRVQLIRCRLPAKEQIGETLYNQISSTALALFKEASSYALSRGLILADTKFEFGLVSSTDPSALKQHLILIDEVLTPDSSRYWPSDRYEAGKPQPSFDKQFLRDWMKGVGFKKGLEGGKDGEGWVMNEMVVMITTRKYEEAVQRLTS
jgi:phosphoribosylaminoimidazole-succinocarboxamide synthase